MISDFLSDFLSTVGIYYLATHPLGNSTATHKRSDLIGIKGFDNGLISIGK